MKPLVQLISAIACIPGLACAETKPERPKPAAIPAYSPARQPVVTGEVPVGLIVVTFKETALPNDFSSAMGSLDKIAGISQEEYFKIYSNGIAWPKVQVMPAEGINYKAPQFYGYYCEYDYWKNPLGWKTLEEGNKRANRMKNDALQFASKNYRGPKPRFICHKPRPRRPRCLSPWPPQRRHLEQRLPARLRPHCQCLQPVLSPCLHQGEESPDHQNLRHLHPLSPPHQPPGDEAVGYLIPSNHPHCMYHVEYIHGENGTVGVGAGKEGMLISVDIQATSCTLNCTIKFRGEPLKTAYGFCWSTRAHPTTKDDTYSLAHRECYRGHAINLKPNTTYYFRAFATNGLGTRYSDEEKSVTTRDPKAPPASIGPLCTDLFSNNNYLHTNFSNETKDTAGTFIGYSPTCVLAKLIAYHRPAKFSGSGSDSRRKAAPIDFNNLSWNPDWDDFPMRLEEVREFFGAIYGPSRQLGLHATKPGKDFVKNLVQLTGVTGKPVLADFTAANSRESVDLIQQDLRLSRPVIILFIYTLPDITDPIHWAMIDGINSKGELHVDFPLHSTLDKQKPTTGYYAPAALMFKYYRTAIVTSLHYK